MKHLTLAALLAAPALAADRAAVAEACADIAEAAHGDSLAAAERLQAAADRLIAAPSAGAQEAAKPPGSRRARPASRPRSTAPAT